MGGGVVLKGPLVYSNKNANERSNSVTAEKCVYQLNDYQLL
jgi:hypothetical protein